AGGREQFQNPYLEAFRARFPRGRIFSADNRLLAVSQPSEQDLRAVAELSPELAADARHRRLRPGERIYPADAVTAHLVGWKSEGRFLELPGSVERDADDLLRGYEPGDLPFYFRVRHNPFVRPPVRQDVQLTIRHDLQKFAVSRMGRAVRGARAAGGALVVYDVTTGDVLAAVTLPTIDPNGMTRKRMAGYQAEHGRTSVLVNKALSREAIYYPGSVFKLFTAGVGLDQQVEGVVECLEGRNRERLSWDTPRGRRRRQANRIRDYRLGTHGPLRLDDGLEYAFTVSCNVFFAGLAAQIGPAAFQSALEEAELELESKAQLEEYLPEAGFGQIAVKYSPIAMAMLAGAVGAAVGEEPESGTARPAWVRAVLRGEKDLRTPENIPGAPDATPYAPFQPETRRALRSLMVQVVENPLGTAYGAFHSPEGQVRLPGITVGGKTGTAEFERALAVRGSRKGRHAWFVGFARSDQEAQPRTIAFAVLLEDVRATVTGGNSCAPVARDLIQQILQAGPIGQNDSAAFPELERLYRERVRTGLGPLAPLVDWLKQRLQRR
ncbi:MAG: hypothetical protein FJX77_13195, partial [Armatimonadetes bacterium]|nr:hypothetical protein [Armatimonadota bacterium]